MAALNQFGTIFLELLTAPFKNLEVFWILIPLLLVVMAMLLYFSKHRTEELGWNTALGNSLVLIFVSLDLLRRVYTAADPKALDNFTLFPLATLLALALLFSGTILIYINFTHFLPKSIAFCLSSPLIVNLTAYVVITLIYTTVEPTLVHLLASALIYILLLTLFTFIKKNVRKSIENIEKTKEKEVIKDVKKAKKHIEKKKQEVEEHEEQLKQKLKESEQLAQKHTKTARNAKLATKKRKTAHGKKNVSKKTTRKKSKR